MKQVRAREEEVKQRETSLRCRCASLLSSCLALLPLLIPPRSPLLSPLFPFLREDALERRQRRLIERERQLQRSLQTHASPSPSIPTSRPPSDSTLLLASVSASVQAREKMRRPGLLTEEEEEEEEEEEKEEDEEVRPESEPGPLSFPLMPSSPPSRLLPSSVPQNLSLGSQASALCDAATAAHRNEDAHTTLEEEGSEDEDEDEDEDEEGLVYRHQTASLSTRRQDSPLGPPLPPPPRPRPSPRRPEAETGQPDVSLSTPPTPPHHAIPASAAASGSNSGAGRGGGRGGRRSCPLSTPPPTTPKVQALFPSLVAPLSVNREVSVRGGGRGANHTQNVPESLTFLPPNPFGSQRASFSAFQRCHEQNTPASLKRSTPPPPLAAPSPISALPSSRSALRPRNPNVALPSHAGQAALQFDR